MASPLFKHRNGQWATKKGKLYYFGTDREDALRRWLDEKDYLLAGLTPPKDEDALQVRDILNGFHRLKKQANEEGAIADRTLYEYEAVCDTIAGTLGKHLAVKLIADELLNDLRRELITNKKGELISPTSQKRMLGMARSVFYYANEGMDAGIKYKQPLRSPTGKQLRKARHETGERLFEAVEIQELLDVASDSMKAMILLGINCGFGNYDCATLPIEQVDLSGGWHNYWC